MTPATWTLSIPWGDYLKCESLVCLIGMTKCIRWNSFLFTGSIVPISPVLWPKTWDLCIIKVIKATICTSKLFTKNRRQTEDPEETKCVPCGRWRCHDCLESLCQGQDPVKGQQLFCLSREMNSAGQKLSELNRSITNYGHEVYFN